jgi:hypothetical protein
MPGLLCLVLAMARRSRREPGSLRGIGLFRCDASCGTQRN